ncbi:hypothetical protein [uncultured Flavonifractor sp.]|uniref:hypothetical protein n=1 Tax=uncultured Flavonifractor sp. TaxID=1193534 RepID=UPI0026305969|nr:hypothetical protein [uncultured Flavonifractor sp.]
MQTKRLAAAALSFTLLLSACGGNPVPAGGSAQPSTPAQESPSAPPSSGIDTGVKMYRDYVDDYYGFKLKTPVLQTEDVVGVGYFIQRGGGDDNRAVVLINHYNEKQDGDAYDTAQFDTAEHALAELQKGKTESMMGYLYGLHIQDWTYTTTACEIDGLEAVRHEGTCVFTYDEEGLDTPWEVGMVGYCILGSETPVLLFGIDMSDAQDKLDVMAAIIDEMAYTYEDGPAE